MTLMLNEEQRKILSDLAHHDPIINSGLCRLYAHPDDLISILISIIRDEAEARQRVMERLEKLIREGPAPVVIVRDVDQKQVMLADLTARRLQAEDDIVAEEGRAALAAAQGIHIWKGDL